MTNNNLIIDSFCDGLVFEKKHNPLTWAEEYVYLSSVDSSETGIYSADRTPYVKEILEILGNDFFDIKEITLMWGAQLGKTRTILNFLGYCIDNDPGPILITLPSLPIAKDWSKERLTPLIDETHKIKEKFKGSSRDTDNAILSKTFPGGKLKIVSAGIASMLRSTPIRFLLMDELDAYPLDVENEGSPIDLAKRRTNTFNNKKILKVSTPTIKNKSNIEIEYEKSDKRKYHVPCPHCNHYQELVFDKMKFQEKEVNGVKKVISNSIYYECESCKGEIKEKHKTSMLKNGKWVKTNPDITDHAGFHLNSLYCPIGWFSWENICNEFIEARNDKNKLKQFINTILAETYEEDNTEIEVNTLIERKEDYSFFELKDDIILLTAGIDVQENRLAVVVLGFGEKEKIQVVYHNEIFGDTTQDEIYDKMYNLLKTKIKHKSGQELSIRRAFIDTGGKKTTQQVYKMCYKYKDLFKAIKGSSSKNDVRVRKGNNQSSSVNGKIKNVELFLLNTELFKDELFMRLSIEENNLNKYISFGKDLTDEFFHQLTSEKIVYKEKNNRIYSTYEKTRSRNEALDCFVYALAASEFFITVDFYFKFEKNFKAVHKIEYKDFLSNQEEVKKEEIKENNNNLDLLGINNLEENKNKNVENNTQKIMKSILKKKRRGKWM